MIHENFVLYPTLSIFFYPIFPPPPVKPQAPQYCLLTALLYMLEGLFCQIPHRSQTPPPPPYRSPGFQSSCSYYLLPLPLKLIHLIHPSIYQSLHAFLYPGRLVNLPASSQCGCISVPCCALCGLVSWQQTNSHDGAPGQRAPCFTAACNSS